MNKAVIALLGCLLLGVVISAPLPGQGFTSSLYAIYRIDSLHSEFSAGFADHALHRHWVDPWSPTDDVTIDCTANRSPGNTNLFTFSHSIVSYLQVTRTEVWADYDHVLRSNGGHVAGLLNISTRHYGWGAGWVDLLGDGPSDYPIGGWFPTNKSLPAIFGSSGLTTKIEYYHEESGVSGNSIEFVASPISELASEGVECGSSLSAIVFNRTVHVACGGLLAGTSGALVVGLSPCAMPIPYSNCLLGTDMLDVIPTVVPRYSGMAAVSLVVPQGPVVFRVQHLHFGPASPGGAHAFRASNTLRVDLP